MATGQDAGAVLVVVFSAAAGVVSSSLATSADGDARKPRALAPPAGRVAAGGITGDWPR